MTITLTRTHLSFHNNAHRSPPKRENCSGLLPSVPRNRKPSPDRTGVVWPVDVLQQQNKSQENQDLQVRQYAVC